MVGHLAGDCRQKLESSQKKLEPVPLIGFLTGLLIKFHIIHKIADSRVYLHLLILFLVLSWTLQRKLWSFWRELSHGTLTYRDREVDHYLCFFLHRKDIAIVGILFRDIRRRRECFRRCKKLHLLLVGSQSHRQMYLFMSKERINTIKQALAFSSVTDKNSFTTRIVNGG